MRILSSDDTKRFGLAVPVAAAAVVLGMAGGATAATPTNGGGGAGTGDGGAQYVPRPEVRKVSCLRRCASLKRARAGSTVKIIGRSLSATRKVIFHGTVGRSDDVEVAVRPGSATRVHARVPLDAISGPVSAQASPTMRSRRSKPVAILPAPPPSPNPTLSPVPGPRASGAPAIETGTSRTQVFLGARRAVVFSYRLSQAGTVQVQLVRARDNTPVMTWSPGSVPAGAVQTIVWNGKIPGAPTPPGRYSFRLVASGSSGAQARSAQTTDVSRDAFDLYDNVFPVRARHTYGGPAARFGAGRGGRSHRGHDVFARCGSRMVAARGGKVRYSGYQGAAGNYVVIRGSGSGLDYVYMHLAEPSPFRKGDRVFTGQRIGSVGDTGRATGCHLHFELWRGGWYDGGRAFNPLSSLQAWDGWS